MDKGLYEVVVYWNSHLSVTDWLCWTAGILWSRNGALADSEKAPTPKPVAIRVMLTSWSRLESTTAPNMRSAFGSTIP